MDNFGTYVTKSITENIRKPLKNFSSILANNSELKNAIDLCIEIEKLSPKAEALVVGGSVRDIILNKNPKDIDIATNVDMDVLEKHFRTDNIGQSKDFGIVLIHFNSGLYEVAQFREDIFDDSSNSRHPSGVKLGATFKKDSDRRDITINALGLSTKGEIVDYQNGLDDIKNGIIKAVGDPKSRFIEDALRMMRVGRFMARYGFKIDDATRSAIIEVKDLIKKVSPERIREELFKAATSGGSMANYIEHLKDVGLLDIILPEISVMDKFDHSPDHHPEGNVLQHTLEALRKSESGDPIDNMAILFHDIGKPHTHAMDGDKITYYGHDIEGIDIFNKVANRLKLSNEQRDAINFAIKYHMVGHDFSKLKKSNAVSIRQDKNWETLKHVLRSDSAARKHLFNQNEFDANIDIIDDIHKKFGEREAFEKKMASLISGGIIMTLVPGIAGKDIGLIKSNVRDWIITRDFAVSKEEVTNEVIKAAKNIGY